MISKNLTLPRKPPTVVGDAPESKKRGARALRRHAKIAAHLRDKPVGRPKATTLKPIHLTVTPQWCHCGVMSDTMEERRITFRIPPVLASRVDAAVLERRAEERKFSMNDWILEAVREKLDGARQVQGMEARASEVQPITARLTPQQFAATIRTEVLAGKPQKQKQAVRASFPSVV